MTDRELMQQALDALKHLCLHSAAIKGYDGEQVQTAINALRARLAQPENDFNPDWDAMAVMVEEQQRMAKRIEELEARLAQPEQEPVAWRFHDRNMWCYVDHLTDLPQDKFKPLYTTPPQREWVGLTDEEYEAMAEKHVTNCYFDTLTYARAIEAKLKEKNI